MNGSILYLATLLGGMGFQFVLRWSPAKNLWLSLLLLTILPYSVGFGLVCGIWVGCAFIPGSANSKRLPVNYQAGWKEVLIYSSWTFAGFLLTLVFLFKIKLAGNMKADQSEAMAWVFFVLLELCIFRIIACASPSWFRVPLGYRMGFLNFLLVAYWVYPYGWFALLLTFFTLVAVFPLLLTLIAYPNSEEDMITGGHR